MQLAIQALEKKEITSLSEASRRFDVPRSTLSGRTKGAIHRPSARANSRKLTAMEEESLLQWIISEENRGLVPLQSRVREMANCLLASRFFDDDSVTVGINWAHNFIKRTKVLRQQRADDPLPDPGQRLKQLEKDLPQLLKILEQVDKRSNKFFSDLNLSEAEVQSRLKSIRRKRQCPSSSPVDLMQQNQQLAKTVELAKCSLAEDQTLSKSARNKQQRSYDRADDFIQHTQQFAEGFQRVLSQLQFIVAENQLRDAENARSVLEEQEQVAPDSQSPDEDELTVEDMLARRQLEGEINMATPATASPTNRGPGQRQSCGKCRKPGHKRNRCPLNRDDSSN